MLVFEVFENEVFVGCGFSYGLEFVVVVGDFVNLYVVFERNVVNLVLDSKIVDGFGVLFFVSVKVDDGVEEEVKVVVIVVDFVIGFVVRSGVVVGIVVDVVVDKFILEGDVEI